MTSDEYDTPSPPQRSHAVAQVKTPAGNLQNAISEKWQ
jgi:hypothetical protein